MKYFDSHPLPHRPKLIAWMSALTLICLLITPRVALADPDLDFNNVFFVAEFIFPDLRFERDDRGSSDALLSWPIPVEVFETSDGLAALDVFGEPQLGLDNLDFRLAAGVRGNWNVFDLLGGPDDTGVLVELGGVYDDFPAVFAGGGIGIRPSRGGGIGLIYRRVWTLDTDAPNRYDISFDYRIYF